MEYLIPFVALVLLLGILMIRRRIWRLEIIVEDDRGRKRGCRVI